MRLTPWRCGSIALGVAIFIAGLSAAGLFAHRATSAARTFIFPGFTVNFAPYLNGWEAFVTYQVPANETPTDSQFEWGTSTLYGSYACWGALVPNSLTGCTFSPLQDATTYHFRMDMGVGCEGCPILTEGSDQTFTTPGATTTSTTTATTTATTTEATTTSEPPPTTTPPTTSTVPITTAAATTTTATTTESRTPSLGRTVLLARRTRSSGCKPGPLPDRRCSPGAYYSGLTKTVICSPTFRTGTIRNVPDSEKHADEVEYGITPKTYGRTIEIDRIVSLELGGSNDIANLFPEPGSGSANYHVKDKLENKLHDLVCAGSITLHAARVGIAGNWETLYKRVFDVAPTG